MSELNDGSNDEFYEWWEGATESERGHWALVRVSNDYVRDGQQKGAKRITKDIGKALCGVQDELASLRAVLEELTDTCPDCNGEGEVWQMDDGPNLDESRWPCDKCQETGLVAKPSAALEEAQAKITAARERTLEVKGAVQRLGDVDVDPKFLDILLAILEGEK